MKQILVVSLLCIAFAGCSIRSVVAAPVELFLGHNTTARMGLKEPHDKPIGKAMDDGWVEVVKSDGYKQTCGYMVDAWQMTHPQPRIVTVLGGVSATCKAFGK